MRSCVPFQRAISSLNASAHFFIERSSGNAFVVTSFFVKTLSCKATNMENFERKMMKVAEEVATSHFRTLCPVWIENFGRDNEFAFVNQIESHLKSFYKQIVDETVVKNQELKQCIASKLTKRGNVKK